MKKSLLLLAGALLLTTTVVWGLLSEQGQQEEDLANLRSQVASLTAEAAELRKAQEWVESTQDRAIGALEARVNHLAMEPALVVPRWDHEMARKESLLLEDEVSTWGNLGDNLIPSLVIMQESGVPEEEIRSRIDRLVAYLEAGETISGYHDESSWQALAEIEEGL